MLNHAECTAPIRQHDQLAHQIKKLTYIPGNPFRLHLATETGTKTVLPAILCKSAGK